MKLINTVALLLLLQAPFSYGMECRESMIEAGYILMLTGGAAALRYNAQRNLIQTTAEIQNHYDVERAENDSMEVDGGRSPQEIDSDQQRVMYNAIYWDAGDVKTYTKVLFMCSAFCLYAAYNLIQSCSSQQ
jgi:hypothetical protein